MRLAVVILAAGQGTRMKSSLPKVLHPLAGRPMVGHVLAVAQQLEPRHTVTVLGHDMEQVRAALPSGSACVPQIPQLGTGHALLQARSMLDGKSDTVLVLYSDTPLIRPATLRDLLAVHHEKGAAVSLLTFCPADATGYGRILRDERMGSVIGIVEHKEATPDQRAIGEANSGILCFRAAWLWPHLDRLPRRPRGEYYLTDTVALAVAEGETIGSVIADDPTEVMGINDRSQLADAEAVLQRRLKRTLMLSGVTMRDPASVLVETGVAVGRDTIIEPNTVLRGETTVGAHCIIGPHSVLQGATIEDDCRVVASVISNVTLRSGTRVGPFAHVRDGSEE